MVLITTIHKGTTVPEIENIFINYLLDVDLIQINQEFNDLESSEAKQEFQIHIIKRHMSKK